MASLADIPTRSGLRVRVGDLDIGLYRIADSVYAMEDACPHAAWPLSKGRLEGCVIECEAHGWPFDVRTGFDPKHADGFPIPCFEVRLVPLDDGISIDIEVDISQQTNDPRAQRNRREGKQSD